MSCNCGCHDDKPPATGWKRFVPLIVAAAVVGVLIAGAVLKKDDAGKKHAAPSSAQSASGTQPGR
ncbi:MAG: hypothetical protein HUU19_13410 [Phycisphaerales bacterium]|nr:hypothetical protein [Phycisphaerales bacterium]